MQQLKHLDLFSGIGGFSCAAQMVGGIETTQFVEIAPYCQKVLAKNFPGVPIHADVTTFSAVRHQFDLVTAGWPCQDISRANTTQSRQGLQGNRSSLFFEIIRIIRQCRPRYVVLENSSALLNFRKGRDMGAVLWELSACGYDAEWSIVSACSVGAPHMRERLFILAYPNGQHGPKRMAIQQYNNRNLQEINKRQGVGVWSQPAPSPSRVPDGVPNRMDRVRALGNAVVPQVAAIALSKVMEMEEFCR